MNFMVLDIVFAIVFGYLFDKMLILIGLNCSFLCFVNNTRSPRKDFLRKTKKFDDFFKAILYFPLFNDSHYVENFLETRQVEGPRCCLPSLRGSMLESAKNDCAQLF